MKRPRRDLLFLVGKRARLLTPAQASAAWRILAEVLEEDLSLVPLPKFKHLVEAVRKATIGAKKNPRTVEAARAEIKTVSPLFQTERL